VSGPLGAARAGARPAGPSFPSFPAAVRPLGLSTVEIADRVLVMEHGRVVEDRSPAELVAGTGRFADLHRAWRDSLA